MAVEEHSKLFFVFAEFAWKIYWRITSAVWCVLTWNPNNRYKQSSQLTPASFNCGMQIKIVSMAHNPNEIDVRAMFSASWKFSASLFLRPIDSALRAYKKKKRFSFASVITMPRKEDGWMDGWMNRLRVWASWVGGLIFEWVSNWLSETNKYIFLENVQNSASNDNNNVTECLPESKTPKKLFQWGKASAES